MDTKEDEENIFALQHEIDLWRNHFLDSMFNSEFKFAPENHKAILKNYFLCIPSETFRDPLEEWHKCISALLLNLNDKD